MELGKITPFLVSLETKSRGLGCGVKREKSRYSWVHGFFLFLGELMKRKSKGFDYKKFYSEKMHGLRWNKKHFHVHHIDLNHDNNDFDNLVLIPAKLHNKFHYLINMLGGDIESIVRVTSRKVITREEVEAVSKYLVEKQAINNHIRIKEILLKQGIFYGDFQTIIDNNPSVSYLRWY